MTVTVASCTLAEIFDAHINNASITASDGNEISGELTLPEYQRPYRWGRAQVERLLSDYKRYLAEVVASPSKYGYYLGSLILHQASEDGCLNIIDGQQRLTTLALIAYTQSALNGSSFDLSLSYDSPESHQQIKRNLDWLSANQLDIIKVFDPKKINLTLVVTRSEDDAYRFFETQNTGGVRLGGPDIIKASHLRAVARDLQHEFASKWEALGDLNPIVISLLKGRYWQQINGQEVPSHREPNEIRKSIVKELGENTGKGSDIAFGQVKRTYFANGCQVDEQMQQGYAMRQPLNSGVNTIHYLSYFEGLRSKYLSVCKKKAISKGELAGFHRFYQNLVCKLEGCSFLKGLYDTSLLLYISQFGESSLEIAAKKLFRVIYSPRVRNQKTVREDSISKFVRENPVLDWIAISYTPEMCFDYLDSFKLEVDVTNLDPDKNSVKKRFVKNVLKFLSDPKDFDAIKSLSAQDLALRYEVTLDGKIVSLSSTIIKQDELDG